MVYSIQGLGKDRWSMKELIEVEHMELHVCFNYYEGIMIEGKLNTSSSEVMVPLGV